MRKEEYLQKLEQLLYGIPEADRAEALQFYRDYLEDAGENVDDVLRSLGTPEELAESIRKDLYGERETGQAKHADKVVERTQESRKESNTRKGKLSAGQWILFIILALCAAPVIVPIFGAIIGVIIAILVTVITLILTAGIVGVVLIIAAIALIIGAAVKLVISPFSALIMLGGGLLMVGLGLIGIAFTVWMAARILPRIFVGIVNWCSRIIHRA